MAFNTNDEPVAVGGTLGAALANGVAMVSLFCKCMNPEQAAAVIVFGNSVIAALVIIWQRRRVSPVGKDGGA